MSIRSAVLYARDAGHQGEKITCPASPVTNSTYVHKRLRAYTELLRSDFVRIVVQLLSLPTLSRLLAIPPKERRQNRCQVVD